MGRVFASSDWHGCLDPAQKVLDFLQPDDKLYFIGDAIDRGPHGYQIMTKLLYDPRVIYIKGNHEEMMLEATLEHQKEDSYEDFIKYWILHLLDPELQVYKLWKDFFIRHGYINEKEEIIYKPEDEK